MAWEEAFPLDGDGFTEHPALPRPLLPGQEPLTRSQRVSALFSSLAFNLFDSISQVLFIVFPWITVAYVLLAIAFFLAVVWEA